MPIYEYQCEDGHHYERSESFEAPTEQACRRCGRPARRLLSLPAVIFKGSGFYSTDSRSDRRASARKDGQGDGGSAGGEAESAVAREVPGKEPAPEKREESA